MACHFATQAFKVETVSLDEPKCRFTHMTGDEFAPSVRQIIVGSDRVAIGEELVHDVTTNESCAAR
jgi:hypothetical protein